MSAVFAWLSGWSRAGRKGWPLSVDRGVTVDRLSCTLLDLGLLFERRSGIMCLQSTLQLQEALGKYERVALFFAGATKCNGLHIGQCQAQKKSYFRRNRT